MSAEDSKSCPACGESIPQEAPDGLCPKCLLTGIVEQPTPPPSEISIEEVQKSFPDFEILELIGIGGIGRVYRVRDPQVDRIVALKILSPDRVEDPEWIERFTREAKALARLNHPHIVQVHSFGTDPQPHLVMEFVDGVNLRQTMEAGGLSAREALVIVPKLCDALHYAHEHGVLHRDIKPENILVDTEGRVKLVDFGLAKLHDEESLPFTLTQSGAKLGTIAYMAPEQVEKPSEVDHRADIYSLGVVFYEMLTGELPLGRFPTPSEANGTDERLDGVVMRTLEKKKEKRFPDAGAMGTEIGRASRGSLPVRSPSKPNFPLAVKILGAVFAIPLLAMIAYGVIGLSTAQKTIKDGREMAARMSAEAERAKMELLERTDWEAQAADEERQKESEHNKQIVSTARTFTDGLSRLDNPDEKETTIRKMKEAMFGDDPIQAESALYAFYLSSSIRYDRNGIEPAIRHCMKSGNWRIRSRAIYALSQLELTEEDMKDLRGEVETVPIDFAHALGEAFAIAGEKDYTGEYAEPMLRLLQRGFESNAADPPGTKRPHLNNLLGKLNQAKVTAEIEGLVVKWTRLDTSPNQPITRNGRGYYAFAYGCGITNKSGTMITRLLEIAENGDLPIAKESLNHLARWDLEPHFRNRVATNTIRLLEQRYDRYMWEDGMRLLYKTVSRDHMPEIERLASLSETSDYHREHFERMVSRQREKAKFEEMNGGPAYKNPIPGIRRRELGEVSYNWVTEASRTDNPEAAKLALENFLDAVQSDDLEENYKGLWGIPRLHQLNFDRAPFFAPIRKHLDHPDWGIRSSAISALFSIGHEPDDVATVIGMIETIPYQFLSNVASALSTDAKGDFTKKHGEPMLRILERGFEVAKIETNSQADFDSRFLLGILWGAKVTPEIEAFVIEWSNLGADETGQITAGGECYNAFYHALSVLANKSTASVERLLHLARNPDTTNIAGRCLWGLKTSVPDKEDQKLVAASVIELLGLRNDDYQWKHGLQLISAYATPEHLPALKELASREALLKDRKSNLESIISKLSQQANQPSQKPLDLAFRLFDEIAPTDDPEAKEKAIQQMLDAMQSDDPEVVLHAVSAYARLRGIAMDRSPFRNPLRNIIGKKTLPWSTREIALNNYFIEEHDPFEEDPLLEFVDAIPIQNVGSFAKALSRHSERDFIARHGATMLRLLQRGYEAARDRKPGAGQSLITALDGARVTPEIEKLLIDWTRLDATDGQPMKSNSRGAFAFRVGLCGISNKSRAAVERLLELAANPDVSIGSRSIHGMRGTIPKIADQKLAASGTLEVLQQRDYEYMWEQALVLLHNYAAEEHLSELREILKRRDLSQDHRLRVRAIIEKIEP